MTWVIRTSPCENRFFLLQTIFFRFFQFYFKFGLLCKCTRFNVHNFVFYLALRSLVFRSKYIALLDLTARFLFFITAFR